MATLTTQKITRAGITPSFAAASGGGDKFTPSSVTYLEVHNGGGGSITVTVAATQVISGDMAVTSDVVTVAAGAVAKLGPYPGQTFLDTSGDGLASITYSGVTSVTIGAFAPEQP